MEVGIDTVKDGGRKDKDKLVGKGRGINRTE